jgi:hypothetical protein
VVHRTRPAATTMSTRRSQRTCRLDTAPSPGYEAQDVDGCATPTQVAVVSPARRSACQSPVRPPVLPTSSRHVVVPATLRQGRTRRQPISASLGIPRDLGRSLLLVHLARRHRSSTPTFASRCQSVTAAARSFRSAAPRKRPIRSVVGAADRSVLDARAETIQHCGASPRDATIRRSGCRLGGGARSALR